MLTSKHGSDLRPAGEFFFSYPRAPSSRLFAAVLQFLGFGGEGMGFANFSSYFVWFVLFFRVGFLRCRMGACVYFKARLFAPFVEALGFLQAHFFWG
jgi:hypothetical protein